MFHFFFSRILKSSLLVLASFFIMVTPLFAACTGPGPTCQYGYSCVNNEYVCNQAPAAQSSVAGANVAIGIPQPVAIVSIPAFIGKLIRALLGLIGVATLVLFIYAGILWMTARGNSDQVERAKTTMIWTTLGFLAVFLSYAVVTRIITIVTRPPTGTQAPSATQQGAAPTPSGCPAGQTLINNPVTGVGCAPISVQTPTNPFEDTDPNSPAFPPSRPEGPCGLDAAGIPIQKELDPDTGVYLCP